MKNIYILSILFFISSSLSAQFAAGIGTKEDPYQVSTPSELSEVRNYMDSYFIQINDIDLSTYDHNNDGQGWLPIGGANSGNSFEGNYDGQDYVIFNLTINRPNSSNVGLFGLVGVKNPTGNVSVKNLGLKNINITGDNGVGALIGGLISNKSTIIEFAYALDGQVVGNANLGGLIGYSNSYINTASTTEKPVIRKTFSSVNVNWAQLKTGSNFGGLIGSSFASIITNSYSRSNVTVDNTSAGISSLGNIGGLIGSASNKTEISYSYSTGIVTGTGSPTINHIGGMIGISEGNVSTTRSFWDTQSSGQLYSDGGTGKTSSQLKDITTFSDYDFINIWGMSSTVNDGYPYLKGDKWGVLPIKLEYFEARLYDNKVELEWETSSEINNDFFTIERSTNGIDFEIVLIKKGAGNSSESISYFAADYNPNSGTSYYRLKQTDFDGKFEYSNIESVKITNIDTSLEIYPNPSTGIFNIKKSENYDSYYRLLDYTGKTVLEGSLSSFETIIDIQNLPNGVYFVQNINSSGFSESVKLIKQ
jgi:hypothetical protein